MKIEKPASFELFYFFLLFILPFTSVAQKLPTVQKDNLHIPANFNIDGKADEWSDKFQAYNQNTQIYYTIANDDHNIYLTIQIPNPNIIYKVIKGGITFTINQTAKKNKGDLPSVTFPVISELGKSKIIQILGKVQPIVYNRTNIVSRKDSITNVFNSQLKQFSKEIKIGGIKSITDSTISIYNENGFKAAGFLNNKCVLTYEFLIPLSYLGLSIENPKKFYYNIQLTGQSSVVASGLSSDGLVMVSTVKRSESSLSSDAEFPTFFWGTYSLLK
jgi:hypothetical protein